MKGLADERGFIVVGNDPDPRRQEGSIDRPDLFFQGRDGPEGVLPAKHHNRPLHHIAAVEKGISPPNLRTDDHPGHVPHKYGNPIPLGNHHRQDVLPAVDASDPPHQIVLPGAVEGAPADVAVVEGQGLRHIPERQMKGIEAKGVHHHKVGLDVSAIGEDRCDPRSRHEGALDHPVLEGPETHEIGGAFECVAEDVAGGSRDGPEDRGGPGRKEALDRSEPFGDHRPGPVDLRAGIEDDRHRGQAKEGLGADRPDPRETVHDRLDGIRDLLLDLEGRHARSFGENRDRDGRDIGEGIHREVEEGHHPGSRQQKGHHQDDRPAADEPDEKGARHLGAFLPFELGLDPEPVTNDDPLARMEA